MKKPKCLKKGDLVAIVSLSWGGLGDKNLIHKYDIAKKRLENDFGLKVLPMPHALKGSEYVYEHPEKRAEDLMKAFLNDEVKAIFCAIGGTDSIRILPYIDYDVIKAHPKIFMGYSDSTVSHLIMRKAGLVSFYGPSIMCEFGEYVKMFDYTKQAVQEILFKDTLGYSIQSSKYWSRDFVPWDEKNISIGKKLLLEEHGYEVLQGSGIVEGELFGGCIETLEMCVGTDIWPSLESWKDKILLLETSDEKISPDVLTSYLRNLGAQGIFEMVKGIVVGKPVEEQYYEEYKDVYRKVLKEFHREELGVIYNVNIGHAYPTGIFPLGVCYRVDYTKREIILLESATIS